MRVRSPDHGRILPAPAAVWIILPAIIGGLLFRSWFASEVMPPPPRMQGETTQAYRYAMLVADGEEIPALDTLVMHPGGMRTGENSILEEYIAGAFLGLAGGDQDSLLRLFCLLFPLLSIPAVYLWMRAAGIDRLPAAAGAALYAVMLPALLRARGESLYRETVALPMLVCLGWLSERSLRADPDGSPVHRGAAFTAAASGVMLFLCLAAWKVTGYFSAFLFIYILFRNRGRRVPAPTVLFLGGAQILASLLLSHMRSDSAITSPSTVMASFAIASVLLRRRRIAAAWLPWIALAAAAAAMAVGPGSTGHVGAVIAAKFRFLFRHPADPALLSPDARLFWVSGYTSPGPAQFLLLFTIPFLAAIPGIPSFIRKCRGTMLLWLPPVSLAGYFLFDRLLVLLAIALVPLLAQTLALRRWTIFPVAAALTLQSVFPAALARGIGALGLRFEDTSSLLSEGEVTCLISWLEAETEPDEAVLSFWHLSGLVSAYAGRPVVTHTFFENSLNRETIEQFSRAVFLPEDSLLALMRETDASLVVYQADFLLDRTSSGLLYLAGLRDVPPDAAAMEMQYHPEVLDSLILVFQGPSLRVFRRGGEAAAETDRVFLFEERYANLAPDYDAARAILADPLAAAGSMADTGLELEDPDMLSGALLLLLSGGGDPELGEMMLNDLLQMYIAGAYDLDMLAEDAASLAWHSGPSPELTLLLARLYASEGRVDRAAELYREVLELDPGCVDAIRELELTATGEGAP